MLWETQIRASLS
ncbi:hypothetical protein YPPY52_4501, partial [Yersinia pestis PY-52]